MDNVIGDTSDIPVSLSNSPAPTPNPSQAEEDNSHSSFASHASYEPIGNTSPKPTEAELRKRLEELKKEQARAQAALAAAEARLSALDNPGPLVVIQCPGESLEKAKELSKTRGEEWQEQETQDASAAAAEATAKLAPLVADIKKITAELERRAGERTRAFQLILRPCMRGVPGSSSAHASM
jgi:DNA repair exonuclease SbcCD ATPase subunit